MWHERFHGLEGVMPWELSQVSWLVRQGGYVAILPWPTTCLGCRSRSKAGLTVCCGLPICMNRVYGSKPKVCPLCAGQPDAGGRS
jgi:hypothetical protein